MPRHRIQNAQERAAAWAAVDLAPRSLTGFAIAALAAWTWVGGILVDGDGWSVGDVATVVLTGALTLAAWRLRAGASFSATTAPLWVGGLAAVVFTLSWGAAGGWWPGNVLFALGLVGMAASTGSRRRLGGFALTATVGASWWVVLDAMGGFSIWTPSNVLSAVGFGLVAWSTWVPAQPAPTAPA